MGGGAAVAGGRRPLLVFNFLLVRYTGDAIAVGLLPYESPEQLADLRGRLCDSHVVAHVDQRILCVPTTAGADLIGERSEIGLSGSDLSVLTRLLHARLKHVLTETWGYLLRDDYPLQLVKDYPTPPNCASPFAPEWLSACPRRRPPQPSAQLQEPSAWRSAVHSLG